MLLNSIEEAMLQGDHGPGKQRCMDILVKFGESVGAERMAGISSAHTMPKEPPDLLAEMTEGVTELGAPTSMHAMMSAFSPVNWKAMGVPGAFAEQELGLFAERRGHYRRCGFLETYTCLPMMVGNLPRKGDLVSWIGTGAQLLANSILGARCNRDGTVVNLAAAITGRAPYYGLYLDENRFAQVLVRFNGLDLGALTHAELGAVGYHVGALAGSRNIVIEGLPRETDADRLKYLMAPLAVSGSVSLCHIVGLTPEAPTLEAALGGVEPEQTLTVGPDDVRACLEQYAQGGPDVDMALFGCPHCSVAEVKVLSRLLEGKGLAGDRRLWIGLPHQQYALAKVMGLVDAVEAAGGVFASSCMATIPDSPIPDGVRTVATNSFKAAHYITRLTKGGVKVLVGDMEDCVKAVTGGPWTGGAS